jgi:hypothetical protein
VPWTNHPQRLYFIDAGVAGIKLSAQGIAVDIPIQQSTQVGFDSSTVAIDHATIILPPA